MTESFIEKLLKRPYVIYACLALFMCLGAAGYLQSDRNLFPDSNYPEIAVVIVEPGASAKSLAANVAVPVEKELYTLDGIRRVYSSTIDEVSVIRAEFEYTRNLDMAAADVENAINKIKGLLSHDLSAPQLHKISAATPPVLVIGISSEILKPTDIRHLAENELKNDLLRLSGVANVAVFGGFQKEVQIIMNKKRLDQYDLNLEKVLAVLKANDQDYAIGFITSEKDRYLLKSTGKEAAVSGLEALWMAGIEFNVVTLTGIILALGLLLDDAVVVMENIERHYRYKPGGIDTAVLSGTKEIMFADLSGTLTTMIALCPILFVGGYPQTIFRPLAATLLLALSASYVISITAVPLLSRKILAMNHPLILRTESFFQSITDRINHAIERFFSNAVLLALRSKPVAALYFIILAGLFVLSLRMVLPLVGQELLPPMDTGGIKVNLVVDPNLPMEDSRRLVQTADDILNKTGRLLRLSSAIGSEPGVLSIGSGGGMDRISMTATYVDRYHREESLWDMARKLRPLLGGLINVKRCEVMDYGATALSSIRANIDVMLSGPDLKDLETAGDRVEKALYETSGVVFVSRTWSADKTVYMLEIDPKRSVFYGLTRGDIARQLQTVLRGAKVASFPLQNSIDFGVRVWFEASNRDNRAVLLSSLLDSPKGKIPLEAVAGIKALKEPDMITREGLNYTLNVYGFREKAAISHIMERFDKAFENTPLPPSVTMAHTGDMKQFASSARRMAVAVGFAVLLTFFSLVVLFNSVKVAAMVLASIPLTLIGAAWALLLLNYHASMPAMMGFILLSGIIVNNAILLIHFAQEKMATGLTAKAAMLESIRIRTRPVLMTAFAVAAGMLPVALGSAIGLERLAPLGAVAIGGLLVGTFLTLLFIPLIFILAPNQASHTRRPSKNSPAHQS